MNNMTTIVIFNIILYKKITLESLFCFFWNKRPNSPQLLCQTSWLRVKRCLFLLWCFSTPSWCFPTYWIKFTNIGKVRSLTYNSIYDHQDSKAPEELASDPSPRGPQWWDGSNKFKPSYNPQSISCQTNTSGLWLRPSCYCWWNCLGKWEDLALLEMVCHLG